MTTDNINQTAIYYVIQGRKLENDSTYIEHTFMDINPEIARQRAFDYLEYYVQLLQQGKQLFFRENEKLVKNNILCYPLTEFLLQLIPNQSLV